MIKYQAAPLKRLELRLLAYYIREKYGCENVLNFPIMYFFELLDRILNVTTEIVPKDEFPSNIHAVSDVANRIIRIREDVYDGACAGVGRDRMTIAHEIAHVILICFYGVPLNRCFKNEKLKPYEDPEWQAKCLAGELMIPYHLTKNMTKEEIKEQCGVSKQAADYAFKVYHQ